MFRRGFETLAPVVAVALETFHSPLAALSAPTTTQNQGEGWRRLGGWGGGWLYRTLDESGAEVTLRSRGGVAGHEHGTMHTLAASVRQY